MKSAGLADNDRKIQTFIESLVSAVLHANPDEKVLVFTEYRATQTRIADALRQCFGKQPAAAAEHRSMGDPAGVAVTALIDPVRSEDYLMQKKMGTMRRSGRDAPLDVAHHRTSSGAP